MSSGSPSERGNILFLILLAVVLFAALSYAITSSMRGGGKDSSAESGATAAADILNFATLVENEIQRLRLRNNVDWDKVNLGHEFYVWTPQGSTTLRGNNSNCPAQSTNNPCAVFTYYGGSVPARDFSRYSTLTNYITSGHPTPGQPHFFNANVLNMGTTATDVTMMIIDLKKEVCDALNKQLGLPLADTQPSMAFNYSGNRIYWADTPSANIIPGNATGYNNQRSFCVNMVSGQYGYAFIHMMMVR